MTNESEWLKQYLELYRTSLLQDSVIEQIVDLKDLLKECHAKGNKVIVAGNGGSAATASHCAVDLTKSARIRAISFNEVDLITCFSNDYGYELWVKKALEFYADKGDVVILISSSGQSQNMVQAAHYAVDQGLKLVTLTGFRPDNPLRSLGDLNFWVQSFSYNVVEMTHQIWLLSACDLIIGKAEYPSRQGVDYAMDR